MRDMMLPVRYDAVHQKVKNETHKRVSERFDRCAREQEDNPALQEQCRLGPERHLRGLRKRYNKRGKGEDRCNRGCRCHGYRPDVRGQDPRRRLPPQGIRHQGPGQDRGRAQAPEGWVSVGNQPGPESQVVKGIHRNPGRGDTIKANYPSSLGWPYQIQGTCGSKAGLQIHNRDS